MSPSPADGGWPGSGGPGGGQAMLLVEQGVLWVLPMLWLVLLLSEAGAVLETGCSLEVGPGSRRPPWGETPRGNQTQGGQWWPWLVPMGPSSPHAQTFPHCSPAGP